MTDSNDNKQKVMVITGKHNKYMMNKISKKQVETKRRKVVNDLDLDPEWYTPTFQLEKIQENNSIIKQQITAKISSYKQQDVLKNRYIDNFFVTYEHVKTLLIESCMHCHYCNEDMYVLYERCRDMQQWSLDRIDNSIGHNTGNLVVSCLKCNLQRKNRDSNKFLETKTMIIKREGIDDY